MRSGPRHASAFGALAFSATCAAWMGCNAIAGIHDGELASGDGGNQGADGGVDSTSGKDSPSGGDSTSGGDSPADALSDGQDVGIHDSTSETQTEAEASGPPSPCGNTAGLQAGSPWPMEARCPTRISQAAGLGPSAATKGWTADLAGANSGFVVAADGTLYVCAGGTLTGIGADSTHKWDATGVTCANTPAIGADGTIYVGGTNVLTALMPPANLGGSPTTKWTFPTAAGTVSSPNIGGDGTVYVTVGNEVYAVSSAGSQRWTYTTVGSIYGMVAIGLTGTIYVAASDTLYALDGTGALTWRAAAGDAGVTSYYPPAVGPNETVLLATGSGIAAVSGGGTQVWLTSISGAPWASPSVAPDGTVYGAANGGFFSALDPASGVKKWSFNADETILSQPVVDSAGSVYFLTGGGTAYALTISGSLLFSTSLGGGVSLTQPVLTNGQVLYVPTTVGSQDEIVQYGP